MRRIILTLVPNDLDSWASMMSLPHAHNFHIFCKMVGKSACLSSMIARVRKQHRDDLVVKDASGRCPVKGDVGLVGL